MANESPTIQVLQASIDPDDTSDFRVLVDNKFVKYIVIDPGVYALDDMCFGPSLISLLPPLPSGVWNKARVSQHLDTGEPYFSEFSRVQLPGITKIWHSNQIDHLALREPRKLRSNVYEVTHPDFESPVIAKFARFEWEVPQLEVETTAYSWIEGHQIGPEFLGHLVEEGRVIGFLIARITNFHHATIEDFPLCQSALSRLHHVGIKHGDVNKHNLLIHDEKATLIDFDLASRPASENQLKAELHQLQNELLDTSGRGGRVVESSPP
ncbi:alpha-galactosidase A precursor [Stachybotrys elegans]|uniref:Alpha-galactosidase A n=1 Tax=Stachybotrys elegans TaxID=80388 RepID=A0A8K0SIF3_9HYPO|nr:alpha-galactosidase A precursor [Stachybotrys elegans]